MRKKKMHRGKKGSSKYDATIRKQLINFQTNTNITTKPIYYKYAKFSKGLYFQIARSK